MSKNTIITILVLIILFLAPSYFVTLWKFKKNEKQYISSLAALEYNQERYLNLLTRTNKMVAELEPLILSKISYNLMETELREQSKEAYVKGDYQLAKFYANEANNIQMIW